MIVVAPLAIALSLVAADEPPAAPAPAPAPAPASSRVKMIILDLRGSLGEAERSAIGNLVTVAFSDDARLEVVSGADVREMIAFEGQKQELGCEASAECLAEIAGALGARLVTYGSAEKLGALYVLTLNVHDTKAGRAAGRTALQGDSVEAIARGVPEAVAKVTTAYFAAPEPDRVLHPPDVADSSTSTSTPANAPASWAANAPPPAVSDDVKKPSERDGPPSSRFFRATVGADVGNWNYQFDGAGVGDTSVNGGLMPGLGLRAEIAPFDWLTFELDANVYSAHFEINGGPIVVQPAEFNALHSIVDTRARVGQAINVGGLLLGGGASLGFKAWNTGTEPQVVQLPEGPAQLTIIPGSAFYGIKLGADGTLAAGPFDVMVRADVEPSTYYAESPDNPGRSSSALGFGAEARARIFVFDPIFVEGALDIHGVTVTWQDEGERRAFVGNTLQQLQGGSSLMTTSGAALHVGVAL